MSSNKYKKLLSDTLLFTISNFGSKVLVFFLVPLYTNILSAEEYGIVDTVTTMTGLLVPVLTLLVSEAVLRFALDHKQISDQHRVLSAGLVLILISSALLLCFTPLAGLLRGSWNFLGKYWLWLVAVYFCNALNHCLANYTRGLDKTKLFAVSGILYTGVLIAANLVYLLGFGMGAEGYLLAIITADIFGILHKIICGGYSRYMLKLSCSKALLKEMLRYSIPMIPSTVAWWVMQLSDKYVIIAVSGVAVSGIYSIAYKIPSIMSVITNVFTQAWQISAIKSHGDKDNADFVSNVYNMVMMFIVGISAVLILMSKHLGYILYAKEYFVAWAFVPILIVAYMFSGLSGVLASVYSAEKKTGMLFVSTSVGAVLNIALNLLLIPRYGAMAAAYTTLIAFAVTWLVRTIHVRTLIRLRVNYGKMALSFLVLTAQAVVVSLDLSFKYWVSLGTIAAQIVLYWPQLKNLLGIVPKLLHKKGK